MAVTDYKFPGTAASVDRDSRSEWVNPNNAKVDDTNYSGCTVNKKDYGDWLRLTNYGFTSTDIPAGSTIDGIQFVICRYAEAADIISDSALYLYDDGAVGSNLASATKWPINTPTDATYGGATDMCGTSLTQADIVATTFGVQLSIATSSNSTTGVVDYIKIRVYYTEGAGGVTIPVFMYHYTHH
jgi:hypothetical protein